VSAPTIDTAPTCPPHLPCPAWCNGLHSGEYVSEHGPHAYRMHFAIAETVELPSGKAKVALSAIDRWHGDGDWGRSAAEVTLHINTARPLVISPGDGQALTLVGLLAWDLYKAIRAAHDLVKAAGLRSVKRDGGEHE
jgi:hypothetical protein